MMFEAPRIPDYDPIDHANAIASRRTPLGEFIEAEIGEGFWNSIPGQGIAQLRAGSAFAPRSEGATDEFGQPVGPPPVPTLTQEQWQTSPHFRRGLPYQSGMTERTAAARADIFDENQYRRWLIQQREGTGSSIVGFIAGMVGGAADPANYIPFAGPAFRAAAAARLGIVAGRAAEFGVNAALGVAASQAIVAPSRAEFGDDVTIAGVLTDIAMGAALGVALGGAAGAYARFRGERLPTLAEAETARAAISEAAADIAAMRAVDVNPRIASLFREGLLGETSIARAERLSPEQVAALPEPTAAALARESAFIPAATKDGRPFQFETLAEAESFAARRNRRENDTLQAIQAETGQYVLVRRTDSDVVRSSDGTPVRYATERAAERAASTIEAFRGAAVIRLADGGFGLIRNASPADLAGLRAAPQFARFPRAEDRSAGASIAREQAAARLARARGEAEIARTVRGRTLLSAVAGDISDQATQIALREAQRSHGAGPPKTAAERMKAAGLDEAGVEADRAAFQQLDEAGRIRPEERAVVEAAEQAAKASERTAKALEVAAVCVTRGT